MNDDGQVNDSDLAETSLAVVEGKGGPKGGGKRGKGPNNGKGLCFNRGQLGHVVDKWPEPLTGNNQPKRAKRGEGDSKMADRQEVEMIISEQASEESSRGTSGNWFAVFTLKIGRYSHLGSILKPLYAMSHP